MFTWSMGNGYSVPFSGGGGSYRLAYSALIMYRILLTCLLLGMYVGRWADSSKHRGGGNLVFGLAFPIKYIYYLGVYVTSMIRYDTVWHAGLPFVALRERPHRELPRAGVARRILYT
ncbi:uncharacterized protein F4807DRAFT_430329 [Annulohypoxylon truncatum]|uniref:uncharacterized protein n=1 Tax=Annulohypoxylon truncatum TaxID=327061 RepID=UPI00200768D0|nr:uncharacterized protein F4807DRAFT_430329 [Annulohypoxylon truncatum]KAI1208602.1 hypothetical protein F4807DRAFT_430329 [Annulohypoxylon truncatum]